ncbi:hypothetical protein BZA70DRAFT_275678 [Myxozyma melibiosi]|uniref:Zn(2)-C6 fungal-type domain-containing protein n=1 Tax=Myxozyma melibiosi TaxID=54550 RepID=A0ABR1F8D1_9ASCO
MSENRQYPPPPTSSSPHHQSRSLPPPPPPPPPSAGASTPGSKRGFSSDEGDMASASPEDSAAAAARLRKIACVECRQQKVKCDAYERSPDICTRCQKRGLQCSIQTSFKRTYKRARLAAVEKEVEELRRSLEAQNSDKDMVSRTLLDLARGKSEAAAAAAAAAAAEAATAEGTASSSTATAAVAAAASAAPVTMAGAPDSTVNGIIMPNLQSEPLNPNGSSSSIRRPPSPPAADQISSNQQLHQRQIITSRTLNGFTVTREQIQGLFLEYETHYHPYLPVLDLSRGPDHVYQKSDLLFWVVLETASRIYSDVALFPILSAKVKELVSRQLNLPMRSAYDVQAILIFTLWPPPAGSLNSDPCWHSCGLAMFNAVKLGLHIPGKTQDFGRVKVSPQYSETQAQAKTWVACNIVSQLLSMALGYPTFSMYNWSTNSALQPDSFMVLPPELRTQLRLAMFNDRAVKLLSQDVRDPCGNVDSFTRRTVIRVLAQELDQMEATLDLASNISKLLLHVARTQLYAYAFLNYEDGPEDNNNNNVSSDDANADARAENVKDLMKAYETSIRTIAFVEKTMDESITADGSFSKLLYLPLYLQLDIVLAAFVILKLQFSKLAELLDTNSGKRHFASAIAIMRKSSVKENDFPIRVSTIMFQLWKLHSKDRADAIRDGGRPKYVSPKLKLVSRMAPSVLFDSIWVWRERYGTFQVLPAGPGQAPQHPFSTHLQYQHQRQQQTSQASVGSANSGGQSKITSPRLREKLTSDGPQLKNTRGVIALLDNTNLTHGPTFEQQNSPLPPPMLATDSSETVTSSGIYAAATQQQQQQQQQQQITGYPPPSSTAGTILPLPSMGTDELVNYLDNEAVAFDHLYLDWQEMGVLWDDMSSIFIESGIGVGEAEARAPDEMPAGEHVSVG